MAIRWTAPAASDLAHVCDYTEKHFGEAQARRAALAIYAAADSLKSMAKRGRAGRVPGTRELTVVGYPFIIIYRLAKDTVEIIRVLHRSQRWP